MWAEHKTRYIVVQDILPETSPALFKSLKTCRGPLKEGWKNTCEPVMCAYKLVTVYFKWFGIQTMVESFGHKVNLFTCFSPNINFLSNIQDYSLNFIEKFQIMSDKNT